ncbi:MAG: endonuclease/exonuclease/phosphatase family protein [Acidimicrobiia bacterium]|nr:endonuclease/exonuclease/phosphatase family protein [Acidimicrobiia bacterium]
MDVTVGTFNLNNLFDRFNFSADLGALPAEERDVRTTYLWEFVGQGGGAGPIVDPASSSTPIVRVQRNADGRLLSGKSITQQKAIAGRIDAMDLDVLAVQEVENRDVLREFNRTCLSNPYPHEVVIEGNDPRFIDVGLLSRFPVANITSHRFEQHPDRSEPVFGRDLLQVDVFNRTRRRRLFTLFINHLKSKFVPFFVADKEAAQAENTLLRTQQAETVARVVDAQTRPNSRYIVLGDMNDVPEADALRALRDDGLGLTDALDAVVESQPPPRATNPEDVPPSARWTSRLSVPRAADRFELLDQIWLSPSLAPKLAHAEIERRPFFSASAAGVGSDHDPVWIRLSGV